MAGEQFGIFADAGRGPDRARSAMVDSIATMRAQAASDIKHHSLVRSASTSSLLQVSAERPKMVRALGVELMNDFRSNKTPRDLFGGPGRSSAPRRLRPVIVSATVGLVASALLATGPAAANPFGSEGIGPPQAEQAGEVCRRVMGLEPGETQFDSCVGSLSRDLRGQQEGLLLMVARQACLRRGLPVGSADLAECELDTARSMPASEHLHTSATLPRASTSFFRTTPGEAFQRAQSSCAALGLEPVSDAFASCVANLNASTRPETPEG